MTTFRAAGFATLDGPDDLCIRCDGLLQYAAGESLVNGENRWFLEVSCPDCGLESLECGRGPAPEPIRTSLVELTGLWAVKAGDETTSTPIMRALRRVYGGTIADARRRADQIRSDGLTGTHGEALVLRRHLVDFGVHPTVVKAVPGSQDELPARPFPEPPHRIGEPLTAPFPELVQDVIAEPERPDVVGYLRSANCVLAGGYWVDPVTRDPRDRFSHALMTDGTYLWSVAWATLVERYGASLPDEFLAHIQALGYQPPKLSAELLHAVAIEAGLDPSSET